MTGSSRVCLSIAALLLGSYIPTQAQSVEFLPEVDVHVTINNYFRTYVQAEDDRDGGASEQFSIGPSAQLYLKPIVKLKQVTKFDLDDSKPRPLVLEVGYRYLVAPDTASTNRMEPIATTHLPIGHGFLTSDRNRADLDWKGGKFTWRYRNKLTLERTFAIHSYHFIPYVAAEPYYVEQYKKWSTTDLYAGAIFPIGKHVQLDSYYEHENDTGKAPNQSKNEIGFTVNLYFSRRPT
jgi:hypothetical protein